MRQHVHFQHTFGAETRTAYRASEISSFHVKNLDVLFQLDLLHVFLGTLIAAVNRPLRQVHSLVIAKTIGGFEGLSAIGKIANHISLFGVNFPMNFQLALVLERLQADVARELALMIFRFDNCEPIKFFFGLYEVSLQFIVQIFV
jgi:hypothetical protein